MLSTSVLDERPAQTLPRHAKSGVDLKAAARAMQDLLAALGVSASAEDLADTSHRAARAFAELLTPRLAAVTTFDNREEYDELFLTRDVAVGALCAHHLLPIVGVANVAYVPDEYIVEQSELVEAVECLCRGLRTEQQLAVEIANWLSTVLEPKGVAVVLETEHLCVSLLGKGASSKSLTSEFTGVLRHDVRARDEFLARSPNKQVRATFRPIGAPRSRSA